jgi:hypothetical protein
MCHGERLGMAKGSYQTGISGVILQRDAETAISYHSLRYTGQNSPAGHSHPDHNANGLTSRAFFTEIRFDPPMTPLPVT